MSIIMAWSKCKFGVAKTPVNEGMATTLTDIGKIKDKSSTLEPSDGDSLEMKATGGETVAKETLEGGYKAATRVIEPTDEFLTLLGVGSVNSTSNEFEVKTHIVEGFWSLEITPKNVGAKGIRAPKCTITCKPGWSEEDGNYVDLEFEILKGEAGYWYSRFTKAAAPSGGGS